MSAAADKAPPLHFPDPEVNSVTGALEGLSCSAERLVALHWSNHSDMNDAINYLPESSVKKMLFGQWMIFTLIGEELERTEKAIVAITERVFEDRRGA